MRVVLVTGSLGLIGSAVVEHFCRLGWKVVGIDNDSREHFFGTSGSTRWNQQRLECDFANYSHVELDVRDRQGILDLVGSVRPGAVVHAAAQPSHDLAARIPFEDFDTNAVGTLNLLESCRRFCSDSPFVFLSTNKVYGDAPNELPLQELDTRWDYADQSDKDGIRESMRIDHCLHSLFGTSKAAADLLVQEYGRYFGMPTCCLRAGCLTGPRHSGVELHGFLSYLFKCAASGAVYQIYGYKGKQVRDNLHADDVAKFAELFIESPRVAAVYNIGGGRANSCSVLEAISLAESFMDRKVHHNYHPESRIGDHICYISNLTKIISDYPDWTVSNSLTEIVDQIGQAWLQASREVS